MGPLVLPKYLRSGRDDRVAAMTRAVPSRVPVAATDLRTQGVNVYRCPVCEKTFRYDDEYEPVCTGPNETTDDHPMTVMTLDHVDRSERVWYARGGRGTEGGTR